MSRQWSREQRRDKTLAQRRMVQFAETFPDREIVAALRRQLGWTHFTMLIPVQDALKRDSGAARSGLLKLSEDWSAHRSPGKSRVKSRVKSPGMRPGKSPGKSQVKSSAG